MQKALPFITAFLIVLGTSVLLYPAASSWINQYRQSKQISYYVDVIDRVEPDKKQQLDQARRYNAALRSGVDVERNKNVASGTGYLTATKGLWDYNDILSPGPHMPMARVKIPSIDVDLPIYHGTSDDVLLRGAGHLRGSSFPVGGKGTRAVVTAHRGLAESRLFTDLDKVKKGDNFTFEVFGDVLTYKVTNIQIVDPEDTQKILAKPGKDLATLITCTPLGINSHRILVTGERVHPTPKADLNAQGKQPEIPRTPWWLIFWVASVMVAVLYVVWVKRGARRRSARPAKGRHRLQ